MPAFFPLGEELKVILGTAWGKNNQGFFFFTKFCASILQHSILELGNREQLQSVTTVNS